MRDLADTAVLGFVAGAIGVAALTWLVARTSSGPKVVGTRHVLTYGVVPRVFAVLAIIAIPTLGIESYLGGRAKLDVVIFSIAFAIIVGGFLALEFFWVCIEYDADRVYIRSPWRRAREIPWTSFQSRKYSATMAWHTFTTNGFGSVHISDWLQGGKEFGEQFERSRRGS